MEKHAGAGVGSGDTHVRIIAELHLRFLVFIRARRQERPAS